MSLLLIIKIIIGITLQSMLSGTEILIKFNSTTDQSECVENAIKGFDYHITRSHFIKNAMGQSHLVVVVDMRNKLSDIEMNNIRENFSHNYQCTEFDKVISNDLDITIGGIPSSRLRLAQDTQKPFLVDEIDTAENIQIIKKYFSTKYIYWKQGIFGQNVKVGIFDSGISNDQIKCNLVKSENFSEDEDVDNEGHGTYISSVICSQQLGIAPNVSLYFYKIFNKSRKTYKSWLLRAIEAAITDEVDILNFSFGGINFDDEIITEKINEVINRGAIIITSAGNEGPSFGTINFPGNLPQVITVSAADSEVFSVYKYSSRGPGILGKNSLTPKPNTWAPGENIIGLDMTGKKVIKNGSSVSCAVVTGFISLLLSRHYSKRVRFNNASMMTLIHESNLHFPNINSNELISGLFNPDGIEKLAEHYLQGDSNPMGIRILNRIIDFSLNSFSNYTIAEKESGKVQLYATRQAITFPLVFVNPSDESLINFGIDFLVEGLDRNEMASKYCVRLDVKDNSRVDPQKGFLMTQKVDVLEMTLAVDSEPKCRYYKESIDWKIMFMDRSLNVSVIFNLMFELIPTPNKLNRILVDRGHNLIYPFDGLIPRDNLLDNSYDYDWTYESIDTNYFKIYSYLTKEGYYIEELNNNFQCADLSHYSVLMLIDIEKKISAKELEKLRYYYEESNLAVFIISDWNEKFILTNFEYTDPESFELYSPQSAGSEIDSLNAFLKSYGVTIGYDSISSEFKISNHVLKIQSASSISQFPAGGFLFGNFMNNDSFFLNSQNKKQLYRAVLGLIDRKEEVTLTFKSNMGRLAIYTDTYCIDDYQMGTSINSSNCFWLISSIIRFLIHGVYVSNELMLRKKNALIYDYENGSSLAPNGKNTTEVSEDPVTCDTSNVTVEYVKYAHQFSKSVTNTIPNLIDNLSSDDFSSPDMNESFVDLLEDILYVLVPLLAVIFIIFIIAKCRKVNYRRTRQVTVSNSLAQLKHTTTIEFNDLNNSAESTSRMVNSIV